MSWPHRLIIERDTARLIAKDFWAEIRRLELAGKLDALDVIRIQPIARRLARELGASASHIDQPTPPPTGGGSTVATTDSLQLTTPETMKESL